MFSIVSVKDVFLVSVGYDSEMTQMFLLLEYSMKSMSFFTSLLLLYSQPCTQHAIIMQNLPLLFLDYTHTGVNTRHEIGHVCDLIQSTLSSSFQVFSIKSISLILLCSLFTLSGIIFFN